jgi:hypothetical protein
MENREKLKVVLEHWLEHNKEHCQDLRQWAGKARDYDEPIVADNILKAVDHLNEAGGYLAVALDQMEISKS